MLGERVIKYILTTSADDSLNVDKKNIGDSRNVRKHFGKRKNAPYQHFLLFPKYFQKLSASGSLKIGIM